MGAVEAVAVHIRRHTSAAAAAAAVLRDEAAQSQTSAAVDVVVHSHTSEAEAVGVAVVVDRSRHTPAAEAVLLEKGDCMAALPSAAAARSCRAAVGAEHIQEDTAVARGRVSSLAAAESPCDRSQY